MADIKAILEKYGFDANYIFNIIKNEPLHVVRKVQNIIMDEIEKKNAHEYENTLNECCKKFNSKICFCMKYLLGNLRSTITYPSYEEIVDYIKEVYGANIQDIYDKFLPMKKFDEDINFIVKSLGDYILHERKNDLIVLNESIARIKFEFEHYCKKNSGSWDDFVLSKESDFQDLLEACKPLIVNEF